MKRIPFARFNIIYTHLCANAFDVFHRHRYTSSIPTFTDNASLFTQFVRYEYYKTLYVFIHSTFSDYLDAFHRYQSKTKTETGLDNISLCRITISISNDKRSNMEFDSKHPDNMSLVSFFRFLSNVSWRISVCVP